MATDFRKRSVLETMRRAGFGAPIRHLRSRLDPGVPPTPWLGTFPRPAQCAAVLGARQARSVSLEIYDANLAGVDLRHPYRDRRLTKFMLAVPAHQLYRRGRFKHLARDAAAGLLPPEIPARTAPTLLTPLFRRGIFDRERAPPLDPLARMPFQQA